MQQHIREHRRHARRIRVAVDLDQTDVKHRLAQPVGEHIEVDTRADVPSLAARPERFDHRGP
jgi:hypothetical protein